MSRKKQAMLGVLVILAATITVFLAFCYNDVVLHGGDKAKSKARPKTPDLPYKVLPIENTAIIARQYGEEPTACGASTEKFADYVASKVVWLRANNNSVIDVRFEWKRPLVGEKCVKWGWIFYLPAKNSGLLKFLKEWDEAETEKQF